MDEEGDYYIVSISAGMTIVLRHLVMVLAAYRTAERHQPVWESVAASTFESLPRMSTCTVLLPNALAGQFEYSF